jgi:predicted outer membrane protein
MDRRKALASLSGVAATSVLFAATAGKAFAQTSMPKTGAPIGEDAYKTQTLMVGTLSKMLSQLAATQAMHPMVKQFAEFEVNEQLTMAQVLTGMANPPPAPLDAASQAVLTQLQSTTGKAFDAAYIRAEVDGHHKLYAIQEEFLNGNPTDMDREHIAMLARTVISMHLTMLGDLENRLMKPA